MRYFLLLIFLLAFRAAGQAQPPSTTVYYGIQVPSAGAITVTSTWTGNNVDPIKFAYDVEGNNVGLTLTNGGIQQIPSASVTTGKKLITIQFGNNLPQSFTLTLTMSNGDVFSITLDKNQIKKGVGNQVSVGYCQLEYDNGYKISVVPSCAPICQQYNNPSQNKIGGQTCLNSACQLSICTIVVGACGNGVIDGAETCDNVGKIGCNADCTIANGYQCSQPVQGSPTTCNLLCGNGHIDGAERCDNVGMIGCNPDCTIKSGYQCTPPKNKQPTTCNPLCGNGRIDGLETCDNVGMIGCKSDCTVDPAYTCDTPVIGNPTTCTKLCGNNKIDPLEQCDNGNKIGCINCKVDSGFECNKNNPSTCTPIGICGDGIRQKSQECDNGGNIGCRACKVQQGYQCYGLIGSSSYCTQQPPICGNSVLQPGEICDNGNKMGCSFNCKIDTGYTCQSLSGQISNCSMCGNGIIQKGQQCDNRGNIGCKKCKIQAGFECRGEVNSFCYRKNPVCGNGVIQIGQSCDDGNKNNKDGCNVSCFVQDGWACTGQFGEISVCSEKPKPTNVCGNFNFEPPMEQCDNGRQLGCRDCIIQPQWSCFSISGQPSVCYPNVQIPKCGNSQYNPQSFQQCDDGNLQNGDGCDNLCQIEGDWVCPNYLKCYNPHNPNDQIILASMFCGNGAVQQIYGQQCDDRNRITGDGCNNYCRVESGWGCGGTYCQRLGNEFCGDGITQGGEQCDDGFPLKGGDGCSITCRVQPGWVCTCLGNNPRMISRCERIKHFL